jgi:hypothetical protein
VPLVLRSVPFAFFVPLPTIPQWLTPAVRAYSHSLAGLRKPPAFQPGPKLSKSYIASVYTVIKAGYINDFKLIPEIFLKIFLVILPLSFTM